MHNFKVKLIRCHFTREQLIEASSPKEAAEKMVEMESDYIPNGDSSRCKITVTDEAGDNHLFETSIIIDVFEV